MSTTDNTVFDQDALPPGVVPIADDVRVYPDEALGWAYICKDPTCSLSAAGSKFHGLSGFTTRALAVDHATGHVAAVRSRRAVIA